MKILKNKRIMIFFGAAILITIVLGTVVVSAINFMGGAITETSGGAETKAVPVRFNFDRLKQIGIIKD